MINERGGINGRKVRFISYDDKSDPSTALELTRGLIEKDDVLADVRFVRNAGKFCRSRIPE